MGGDGIDAATEGKDGSRICGVKPPTEKRSRGSWGLGERGGASVPCGGI